MLKAHNIIGMPVIEVELGKQLGVVKDILLNEEWDIQGIVIESKLWFSTSRFIAWDDMISCGEDAVTIPGEQAVQSLDDLPGSHLWVNSYSKVKGLPVITVNGNQLGILENVYFDSELGRKIIGYEISDGFISDMKNGRKWLPSPDKITFGEDAIIVPVESDQDLKEIVTSIKK